MHAHGTVSSLEPYGLAETCRIVGGSVPLWHYHRARLLRGRCPQDILERVEALALTEAAHWAESSSRRVRLGVTVDTTGEVHISAGVHLSSLDVVHGPVAVRVNLSEVATAENPAPPLPAGAAKPADRSWWDVAQRLAKKRGGHQAIIVDDKGVIVDGGSATVWIAEKGRLVTPESPLAVGGVARAFILDALARKNVEVAIEPITWERFEFAEEAFLTNAFAGAVGVRDREGDQLLTVRTLFALLWGTSGGRA